MSRHHPIVLALALLAASPMVLASEDEQAKHAEHHAQHHGDHHEGMPPDFAKLDANGDGQLEKSELPEGHRMAGEHFDMIDKDKDGKVSKAEFDAMHAGHDGHH